MQIIIDFVPSIVQRYDTAGDWFYTPDGTLMILVSNDNPEFPTQIDQEGIALHELMEALLCGQMGVTQKQVDDWDMQTSAEEPGDDPEAPYHEQHTLATIVEALYVREAVRYNRGNQPVKESP